MKPSKTSIVLPIALAAGLLTSLVAEATPAGNGELRRVVSYQDLDLRRSDGAATLHRRIKMAAREVCGFDLAPPVLLGEVRRCVNDAVSRAVVRVDQDQLTSFHAEQVGSRLN